MAVLRATARVLGRAPIRRLGIGSDDEPRGYVEQLTGWARTGVWHSTRGQDYLAQVWRIDCPIWAATGDGDRLCRPRDAEVITRRLRGVARVRRVGRAAGDAIDADHFSLFTRASLAPVWDEAIAFIGSTDAG